MGITIAETDWKVFREVRAAALERFCEQIMGEVARLAGDKGTGSHERYLLVYELIQQRDKDIVVVFNDFRRSTAVQQIGIMQARGLFSAAEFARFSAEVREQATGLADYFRARKDAGN